MVGLCHFSTDPEANAFGAAPIDWREGMAAKGVNNSGRIMMAALAAWRDDNSGKQVAAGVTTGALTLATAQGVTVSETRNDLKTGLTLSFRVSGTNPGPSTLKPDDAPAKPLRRPGNLALAPGDLAANRVFQTIYSEDLGAHLIVAPAIELPGKIDFFATAAAIPPGWVTCDGSALSRTVYAALFAAIGTTHGPGDGATTFNVPDMRGRTGFGADGGTNRLSAAGGLTGAVGDVGGSATTSLTVAQMPAHDHGGETGNGGGRAATNTGADGARPATSTSADGARPSTFTGYDGGHAHNGSTNAQNHNHTETTASGKNGVAAAGSGISGLWYGPEDAQSTGNKSLILSFTTDPVNDHRHTIPAVPDHSHTVPAVPDHTHTVPAVPDHDHTIPSSGAGAAHANMPPGLVAVWAIKA